MTTASDKPKRRQSGYRGLHREGSNKGDVHRAYDEQGPAAAAALASERGLAKDTFAKRRSMVEMQPAHTPAAAKPATRVAVNISIDPALVAAAKDLDVNVSRAAETGIAAHVQAARRARWLEENAKALESSNRFAENSGLPLARHRMF